MGHSPLVTAGLVSGAAVLAFAAVPASAAPADQPRATYSPHAFKAGDNLWVRIDGCITEPRLEGSNEAFDEGEPGSFEKVGDLTWRGIGGTLRTLKPGNSYMTRFGCMSPRGHQTFPLWVTPPDPQVPPPRKPSSPGSPSQPGSPGGFSFGHDDVDLSTVTVKPGGTLGIRVTCPSSVRATSASFVSSPHFSRISKTRFEGTARFDSTLPSIVKVTVECAGYGSVTFSTTAGGSSVGEGEQEIPSGAPNTGDGSLAPREPDYTLPIAATAALAFAIGLLTRRRA